MSDYTIVDAEGEIVKAISVPNAELMALNTPDGHWAIGGMPPTWNSYYDFADFEWIDKGSPATPSELWDAVSKAWVDQRTLQEARVERWAEFRSTRDQLEFSTFAWDGSVFDGDPVSQSRIQGAVVLAIVAKLAGDTTYVQSWKLANNTTRTLTTDDMIAVGVALGLFVKGLHTEASSLYEQLQEAGSKAAINALQWQSP